jgi:hypothetical protein
MPDRRLSVMDSNKANVGTFYLTIPILVLTAIGVGLMAWSQLSPRTAAQASPIDQGGAWMTRGWLSILFVIGGLVLAIVLQVFLGLRLRKNKTLRLQRTKLTSDLGSEKRAHQLCKDNYKTLEGERDGLVSEKIKLSNELALATPNKRLAAIANNDAAEIQEAVIVCGVHFRNEIEYGNRHIDFTFSVFNQSVYDISIDDALGDGDITFNQQPLVKEKRIISNKAQNVQPRQQGLFTIRQFLDAGDMQAITNATDATQFWLDGLKIKIKGGAGFENVVEEKRLTADCYLSKQTPQWWNYKSPLFTRFEREITGKVGPVYFQHKCDIDNFAPGQDYQYDFYFVLHAYISNHGAPTGIERFRLVLKANGQAYEGRRIPLSGCRRISPGAEEILSERDIENHNDVTLTDTRRGWLQFFVPGVKRYDEDHPKLEMELDVIDKDETPNRLTPPAQDKWMENSMKQESYINGPGIWQQF